MVALDLSHSGYSVAHSSNRFLSGSHPAPAGQRSRFSANNQRHTRSGRHGAAVRYLHGLSATSDLSYSPPHGGALGAFSPDHGKRRRHDCGGGFGGTPAVQQPLLSENSGLHAGRTAKQFIDGPDPS